MNRGALWLKVGLGISVGLLALAWLGARSLATASPAGTRAHTWTWPADVFDPSPEGFLSPLERAPFPFTAAAVHLKPSGIAEMLPTVELRLRADDGDWSPWYPIEALEPQGDGRLYGESLVAWPGAREVQVRVKAASPLPRVLRDLTVVAIDARGGPTAVQARLSAWMREVMGMALLSGDPGVPQPTLITRADWGADEDWMTWSPEYEPVDKMMVHHTASGGGDDPAADVRAVYYYHAVVRGWGDIGYNYLVDKFGNIYEGRYGGPDVVGAHVGYWNEGSLGVSVIGCYDYGACSTPMSPTGATLGALADVVAWTASRRGIDPRAIRVFNNGYSTVTNYVLAGHRDYASTTCPGGNLYAELPSLRSMAWDQMPDYDVRFDWHDTPSALETDQRVTVYPNLYNYGRLVWSDDGGVRLGYRWLQDEQVVVENADAARIVPGAVVNFGEMTALVAQLDAPSVPGTFTLRWDLYREGVGWFSDQPAPAGRSQPLDLTVEVTPALTLDVWLNPPDVARGDAFSVDIALSGPVDQAFEARTRLPSGVSYVAGSGQSTPGTLYLESDLVRWAGAFETTPGQARFTLVASTELSAPLALSTTTTLSVTGNDPLIVRRWFIVDGFHSYLPLIVRD